MADADLACPACATPMGRQAYPKKLGGEIVVDICPGCRMLWFDRHESLQLAADGVLDLFRLISAQAGEAAGTIPDKMGCPRCNDPLLLTHDMQRSTRFVYYRCASGHGKLTAFYQFLREKNFVRSLSPVEVERLKADVKQVRCSGCGAPINLATDSACPYCKAPIAMLDADAMRATLAEVEADAQKHRQVGEGLASVEGLMAANRGASGDGAARSRTAFAAPGSEPVTDLLAIGIGLVADIFLR